ncbi:MAG: hypothetical protein MUD08_07765 [Cytophagales bacterium]|jgi:hypothetical protein|nr:hypothetical protein [Cytophagales bacterium]
MLLATYANADETTNGPSYNQQRQAGFAARNHILCVPNFLIFAGVRRGLFCRRCARFIFSNKCAKALRLFDFFYCPESVFLSVLSKNCQIPQLPVPICRERERLKRLDRF